MITDGFLLCLTAGFDQLLVDQCTILQSPRLSGTSGALQVTAKMPRPTQGVPGRGPSPLKAQGPQVTRGDQRVAWQSLTRRE